MTNRKPPQFPPPVPGIESYRPGQERSGPPAAPHADAGGQARHGSTAHGQHRETAARRQRRDEPRNRSGLLTGLFYGMVALVALVAGAVVFLLVAVPTETLRNQILAEVKAKTGRDLAVAGPTSLSLYPSIGLAMRGVSLSPPPGMDGAPPLATIASLEVSVRLLPLLRREAVIERFVLHEPVFHLAIDKTGRRSWEFAALAPSEARPPIRLAEAQAPLSDATPPLASAAPDTASDTTSSSESRRTRLARLERLELRDVRIENGTVRYEDARSGARHEVGSIDMQLSAKSISHPAGAKGSLAWNGATVDFDAKLTSLKAVLEDRPAKLALAISSTAGEATFDGSLSLAGAPAAEGAVTAKSASARALANWLGATLPPGSGFAALEAKGQLRATEAAVTLSEADITLDGSTAAGQVTLETAGERPLIKANLKLSELDLNRYLGESGVAEPAQPPLKTEGRDGAAPRTPARSIDDLLERESETPGTQVKGFLERDGWSEERIDLSALAPVDADARLSVGRLRFKEIKAGQSQLTVALKNGVLKTTLDDAQLYEGRGRGFITIDASAGKTLSVGANLVFDGVAAQPFLADAAAIDWISGKGRLALALAGQGRTEREIVATLNGKADFAISNGAIVGIDIPHMADALSQGRLGDLKSSPGDKTDFSEFAASWTVSSGVARNEDLRLISPALQVSGAGIVMLAAREIDYTMRPKLAATAPGGQQGLSGLEIPVRVHGSWERPDFKPDLQGVDTNHAIEAAKEIGKQLKGKDAGEFVDELVRKGPNGEPSKVQKFLDKLFKQ